MINSNISFGTSFHFLNKSSGIYCAYCGERTITESEIKRLHSQILGLKGAKIAQILEPYLAYYKERKPEALQNFIELAQRPDFQDKTFSDISLHLPQPKVYNQSSQKTLWNLLNDIMISVDHIQPRFLQGKSEQINYLPMHRFCNTKRGHVSYGEILATNPDFLANIKKSLAQIKVIRQARPNPKNLPDDYLTGVKLNLIAQGVPADSLSDI